MPRSQSGAHFTSRVLLDQIADANPFEIPSAWVSQLIDGYANAYQVPEEERTKFRQEFRPVAEKQVRRDLNAKEAYRTQLRRGDRSSSELARTEGELKQACERAGFVRFERVRSPPRLIFRAERAA